MSTNNYGCIKDYMKYVSMTNEAQLFFECNPTLENMDRLIEYQQEQNYFFRKNRITNEMVNEFKKKQLISCVNSGNPKLILDSIIRRGNL